MMTKIRPSQSSALPRRSLLQLGALAACLPLTKRLASGQEATPVDQLYVDDELDQAVQRATAFLLKNRQSTGAISGNRHQVALSSLAIMALASVGNEPGDKTPEGEAMSAAIDYVLEPRRQSKTGYLGQTDGSRMYGHGITTLMLTEMLGMGATVKQNQRIHECLAAAIRLILSSQAVRKQSKLQGGWRYAPDSSDSDLSVSIWQLMALRSAKNDGLDVPGEAIDDALQYLRNSYTGRPGNAPGEHAGFSYTPGQPRPTFTMTAAGLLAMQVCGQYEAPEVKAAAQWLLDHPPKRDEHYLMYGLYYYSQGMYQVGGKFAKESREITSSMLLPTQQRDGSWQAPGGEEKNIGPVYSTALAMLSLSVRYHYLPIYQR